MVRNSITNSDPGSPARTEGFRRRSRGWRAPPITHDVQHPGRSPLHGSSRPETPRDRRAACAVGDGRRDSDHRDGSRPPAHGRLQLKLAVTKRRLQDRAQPPSAYYPHGVSGPRAPRRARRGARPARPARPKRKTAPLPPLPCVGIRSSFAPWWRSRRGPAPPVPSRRCGGL
jgi:hypothetical protein